MQEFRVQREVFQYYCGIHSRTATLDTKLLARNVRVSPENCQESFKTGKIRIDNDIRVTAEDGEIIAETIYRGGEIGADGTCVRRAVVRKEVVLNNVVHIEDYIV